MSQVTWRSTPFLFHVILETPAVIAFALFPSATLRMKQPEAHPVIRQYALLLLTTILIAVLFAFQSDDVQASSLHAQKLEYQVAGALSLYHVGPMIRAIGKLTNRDIGGLQMMPCVHLLSHGICCTALAGRAYQIW